jgi:hypothetical protein
VYQFYQTTHKTKLAHTKERRPVCQKISLEARRGSEMAKEERIRRMLIRACKLLHKINPSIKKLSVEFFEEKAIFQEVSTREEAL